MRRTMTWKGIVIVCGMLIVAFLIIHTVLQNILNQKNDEYNARQAALIDLQNLNKDLTAEMETVGTNAYVENSARVMYSYVQKGELRFEFTNPEALGAYTPAELQILMDEMAD
ncbi:MAG: septum formation initiator family protein [Clostridia bacterium]|nr:septum formation initiator family protein [Clostridia bacterium]